MNTSKWLRLSSHTSTDVQFFNDTFAGQDDILMFGGSGGRESRPQYVQNEWSIATEFLKDFTGVVCPTKLLLLGWLHRSWH